MPNDPFVDSEPLSSLGPVRYLDARDQAAFGAGHAPNACARRWMPGTRRLRRRIGFGQTAFWEDALGSLGVGPGVTAVTYDAGGMTRAGVVRVTVLRHPVPDRERRLARAGREQHAGRRRLGEPWTSAVAGHRGGRRGRSGNTEGSAQRRGGRLGGRGTARRVLTMSASITSASAWALDESCPIVRD
jgi:hypothetical protein